MNNFFDLGYDKFEHNFVERKDMNLLFKLICKKVFNIIFWREKNIICFPELNCEQF